jgi:hypothetical protein
VTSTCSKSWSDQPPPQVWEASPEQGMLHQGALDLRAESWVVVRSPHQHSVERKGQEGEEVSKWMKKEEEARGAREEERTISVLKTGKVVALTGASGLAGSRGAVEEEEGRVKDQRQI